jgi:uncharacterized membrane protein YhaH (DUF805 family)
MHYYTDAFADIMDFNSRTPRKAYWMFILINVCILIAIVATEAFLGMYPVDGGLGPISGLYQLIVLVPGLAIGARRLHDTGRPGWWLLAGLFPFFGPLLLLYYFIQDSEPETNLFGLNPKADWR